MNKKIAHIIIITLLSIITFVSFYPTLGNQLTNWDDDTYITKNPDIRSLDLAGLKKIFTAHVIKIYSPLTVLSFALEYKLFKLNDFWYHFNNLLLHICVVLLIYYLGLKLQLSEIVSAIAALIFAIHPMHVESVAWISERKDVLYSMFYLLAVINYIRYLTDQNKQRYTLSLVFGFLSMLAKPMALSLPLILFLIDRLRQRKFDVNSFLDKIPHFVYVIAITLITYVKHARIPLETEGQAPLIWVWTSTFYIKKFFWPFDLNPLYDLPRPVAWTNISYSSSAVLLAGIIFLFIIIKNKWFRFAISYYVLSAFFLFRYDYAADLNVVADRFMYLPSLGICFALGVFINFIINKFEKQKGIIFSCIGVIFLAFVIMTHNQTKIWRDSITLWNYVVQADPKSIRGFLNRGNTFIEKGQYHLALGDFNKAISLSPDFNFPDAYFGRGNAYSHLNAYDMAIEDYTMDIAASANPAQSYNNRGEAYRNKGNFELALKNLNKAIELDNDFAEAYYNLGNVYRDKGDLQTALINYTLAIDKDDHLYQAYNNRASIYAAIKEYDFAIIDYSRAIKLLPENVSYYNNRGSIYRVKGDLDKAYEDFSRAIEIDIKYGQSYYNRAIISYLKHDYAKSLMDIEVASKLNVEIDPSFAAKVSSKVLFR